MNKTQKQGLMITSIKIDTILLLSVHISNQNIQLRVMLSANAVM